jgi:hypothetical protein
MKKAGGRQRDTRNEEEMAEWMDGLEVMIGAELLND